MEDLQRLIERHQYIGKTGTAFIYAILVSIAVNFFLDTRSYLFIWSDWVSTTDYNLDWTICSDRIKYGVNVVRD